MNANNACRVFPSVDPSKLFVFFKNSESMLPGCD